MATDPPTKRQAKKAGTNTATPAASRSGMARTRRQPSADRPAPGRQIEVEDHATPHRVTLDLGDADYRTLREMFVDAGVRQMEILRAMIALARERPGHAAEVIERAQQAHQAAIARRGAP